MIVRLDKDHEVKAEELRARYGEKSITALVATVLDEAHVAHVRLIRSKVHIVPESAAKRAHKGAK